MPTPKKIREVGARQLADTRRESALLTIQPDGRHGEIILTHRTKEGCREEGGVHDDKSLGVWRVAGLNCADPLGG
jgi:hypothetical protein